MVRITIFTLCVYCCKCLQDEHRHTSTKACLQSLKAAGYRIVATTPHQKAHRLEDFDITQKAAIFFGRETQGLSADVLEAADDFIYIPMVGFTESLNISVSAAITLQHIMTRLKASSIPWQLSDSEVFGKKLEWTKKMIKDGLSAPLHNGAIKYYKEAGLM